MNRDEITEALSKAAELANVAVRITHAIDYFEQIGDYCIGTDMLRSIMQAALDEDVMDRAGKKKEYDESEFSNFLRNM